MSLVNCRKKRYDCGIPFPSSCVSYEGELVGVLKKEELPCDVNLDDVIEKLSTVLKKLETELEALTKRVGISEEDIIKIKAQIEIIKNSIKNIDPSQIFVTIDLGCLTGEAAPCKVGTNKYSLLAILQLFAKEICLLKA
jgi:hypothetical protein